ncbi:MAG: single-stranded-DNA-specific exonuclease RecJ [Candidatus Fibromonas sp.]|jgi:single-stranded-DNA-specific exonuclease|nr:single-stranded-DNA-specific exonuclease RecJ [Candidatus Fibromonas sp.]
MTNAQLSLEIAKRHKVSVLLARILVLRGVKTLEEADRWLDWDSPYEHDPFLMQNMDKAIDLVLAARESKKNVWIYGDYDLDGISGAAILAGALGDCGLPVHWMLPNRFDGGYGLSMVTLQKMRDAGAEFLILVDTGITAKEEIKAAKEFGMQVLVLDHHKPSGEGLPVADVILDPFLDDCEYPNKALCAAGVAYKFLHAFYQKTGKPHSDLEKYLPLVSLGSLADIVPLSAENLYLVRKGMDKFPNSDCLAIQILYEKFVTDKNFVNSNDIHYRMAPLLNAPGRMESPDISLEFLLCKDKEEIEKLYEKLVECNTQRRKIELDIHAQAIRRLEKIYGKDLPKVLIIDALEWNIGVIGIVAARIAQEYKRPTAIISVQSDGVAAASARSAGSFNWHAALFPCRDIFIRWGGHVKAAGFNMVAEKINELRIRIEEQADLQGFAPSMEESTHYDLEVSLSELSVKFLNELKRLEPFGNENPYPVFLARQVAVRGLKQLNGGHMRFYAVQGRISIPAIAFNKAYLADSLEKGHVNLVFEVRSNVYQGVENVQLIVLGVV